MRSRRKIQSRHQFAQKFAFGRRDRHRDDSRREKKPFDWVIFWVSVGLFVPAAGSIVFNSMGYWLRFNPDGVPAGVLQAIIAAVLMAVTIGADIMALFSFEAVMEHHDAKPQRKGARNSAAVIFMLSVFVCVVGAHFTFEAIETIRHQPLTQVEAQLTAKIAERERKQARLERQETTPSMGSQIAAQAAALDPRIATRRIDLNDQARSVQTVEEARIDARDAEITKLDEDIALLQGQVSAYKPMGFELVAAIIILAEVMKALGRWAMISSRRKREEERKVEPVASKPAPAHPAEKPANDDVRPGHVVLQVRERTRPIQVPQSSLRASTQLRSIAGGRTAALA